MGLKISVYNSRHESAQKEFVMPKRKAQLTEEGKSFGERLARFRQAAGYSQRDFAAETGISQRMVVYYEKACERIPIQLLPVFARALGISADQLLGLEKDKDNGKSRDNRLWRRFTQVEKLPPAEPRPIIQFIDAILEKEKFRKAG
ncbi:MAG TPA: XRE family transcriptional regulator [Nitrospiraceae bacterium]|nr:XRE family transcriptional regulator [Nitrospiraceae bacterium]